jgi:formate C-acetyltransferase
MRERVRRLRQRSLDTHPSVSIERALLLTEFYRENIGKYPQVVLRAKAYHHLCANKTIYIGDDELIVGERGHEPKATPTYPEITCHSAEDLRILDSRPMTSYTISDEDIERYERDVIPFWSGRSLRDRIFDQLSEEWHRAFSAGVFTEFMEQRAPGHTVGDGKIFRKGMLDFKAEIAAAIEGLDSAADPEALAMKDQLEAMEIVADAAILFAERHADAAEALAVAESDPSRREEFKRIAEVCRHVPAKAPRDFWEALQSYWFVHLGVITELNGWDAYNPGHLDQHLEPFYREGLEDGSLDRESAKELLECLWVKFNNHPAPPKVGVTAEESGTYTDFANINIGGVPPAFEQHPAVAQEPGRLPRGRAAGDPQGLRLPIDLQLRRGREGAGEPGQDGGGRSRGWHLRLCRDGRLRQGSLHPDRLLQPAEDARARITRRLRSAHRRAARTADR